MKELCEKYKELRSIVGCVTAFSKMRWDDEGKNDLYKHYKEDIDRLNLTPEEYETCIRWFCEVMEY